MQAKGVDRGRDRAGIVLEEPRVDVGGAGGQGDTVRDSHSGHLQRGLKFRGTIVDAG